MPCEGWYYLNALYTEAEQVPMGYLLIINEVAPLCYQALESMTGAGSNLKLQYLYTSHLCYCYRY